MALVPKFKNDMNTLSGRTELIINFGGDPLLKLDVSTNHAAHIGEVTTQSRISVTVCRGIADTSGALPWSVFSLQQL